MIASFNVEGARESLLKISEENMSGIGLANIAQTARWTDGIKVTRVEHPTTWRLLQGGNDEQQEEIVFTVRGVVVAKDLPPVLQRPRLTPARYKYLRQGITISGLGIPMFDQAIKAASEIYGMFNRTFADGQTESWSATGSPGPDNYPGLDASNRYMTPRRDVPGVQHMPFPTSVDPKGILEGMIDPDYVHAEENNVLYFTSRVDGTGKRLFDAASPQIFRLGDVVEIQVSFVAVPLRGEQYKMVTVMRSIALLDGTFGQTTTKIKKAPQDSKPASNVVLRVKRRVGYETTGTDAEVEGAPDKRQHMDVDDATAPLVQRFTTQMRF